MTLGAFGETIEHRNELGDELCAEPGPTLFVPVRRSLGLALCLGQNPNPIRQRANRARRRARTSLHWSDCVPALRAADTRRSISSIHARSHSGSGAPSTLSSSSVASSNRSCSESCSAAARTSEARPMCLLYRTEQHCHAQGSPHRWPRESASEQDGRDCRNATCCVAQPAPSIDRPPERARSGRDRDARRQGSTRARRRRSCSARARASAGAGALPAPGPRGRVEAGRDAAAEAAELQAGA
jgi:hypothetical protein